MGELTVTTKYGKYVISEKAIEKVLQLQQLLNLSLQRAVEVIIETPEVRAERK